jgi:Leucine-rich repeat (LRR) protein
MLQRSTIFSLLLGWMLAGPAPAQAQTPQALDSVQRLGPEAVKAYFEELRRARALQEREALLLRLDTLPAHTKALALRHADFEALPEGIWRFHQLEQLELDRNRLSRLPRQMRQWRHSLRVLRLSGNPLEARRLRLHRLRQLQVLDLSACGLDRLPRKLHKLKHLDMLVLSNNQLAHFRPLRRLRRLHSLAVSQNPLRLGDGDFAKGYRVLETLEMHQCGLEALPRSIGDLDSLRQLLVPENRLASLPEELGRLRELETLMLYKNGLREIPPVVFTLEGLTHLDLYYNELETLPGTLGRLSKLEVLYLSHNRLSALPEELGGLGRLQEIYLHHNRLTDLPASMRGLRLVRYLHLHQNQLARLPEWLAGWPALETLTLSGNALAEVPAWVGELPALRYLGVEGLPIEPDSPAGRRLEALKDALRRRGVRFIAD